MECRRDGQGNLIAPDGLLYPQWLLSWGRSWAAGPCVYELGFYWGLNNHPMRGERRYLNHVTLNWGLNINSRKAFVSLWSGVRCLFWKTICLPAGVKG
tara:strand:+ start:284 stop:577 length:294 start_codon:yes stop_codon:yes gene_type:complete